MRYFAKIDGVEHELLFADVRPEGSTSKLSPAVVVMSAKMEHTTAKELLSSPGEWSVIVRHDPVKYADGTVIQREDEVTDCTDYSILRHILDTNDGRVEIVMGKITAEEALAELVEALK